MHIFRGLIKTLTFLVSWSFLSALYLEMIPYLTPVKLLLLTTICASHVRIFFSFQILWSIYADGMSRHTLIFYPLFTIPNTRQLLTSITLPFSPLKPAKNALFLSKNPNRSNKEKVISYVKVERVYVMW